MRPGELGHGSTVASPVPERPQLRSRQFPQLIPKHAYTGAEGTRAIYATLCAWVRRKTPTRFLPK